MALFLAQSRYVRHATTYVVVDRRGRTVHALTAAEPPAEARLGEHARRDGQRLDHLANFYLRDACGFWRLAEHNEVLLPDALAERATIAIPVP